MKKQVLPLPFHASKGYSYHAVPKYKEILHWTRIFKLSLYYGTARYDE